MLEAFTLFEISDSISFSAVMGVMLLLFGLVIIFFAIRGGSVKKFAVPLVMCGWVRG